MATPRRRAGCELAEHPACEDRPVPGRDEIIEYCDRLLAARDFVDYGPNGLQIPGAHEVRSLVTGVSAGLELIERTIDSGAELLLVHHGLFWEFHPRSLSEQMAARLRAVLAADLNLAAYHLPLDAHPELGNNALLCERLGFRPDGRFADAKGHEIGVIGVAGEPIEAEELTIRIRRLLDREPLLQGDGPPRLSRIGIVSGAGGSYVGEAAALGLDALITGEPAEHVMADAREAGLHFYAAGHYATETLGIRRLGEQVADHFGLEHSFIDVPNPV
jgi:dinuclear metal center YbgI/SA1388 family protein